MTDKGVTSFFAPQAKVEFRIGGAYEMYFAPDSEPGSRGGEGNRILSYLPKEMLTFEWNAPPSFPEERKIKTYVVVQLKDEGFGKTRVILTHHGWGKGGNCYLIKQNMAMPKFENHSERGVSLLTTP